METEGSWMGVIDRELCVQRGEREKGAEVQKGCAFLLCFVLFPSPPCLGFLGSIRPPRTRATLCGYSSCHLLLAVLAPVSSPNPVIPFKQKHLLRAYSVPGAADMGVHNFFSAVKSLLA